MISLPLLALTAYAAAVLEAEPPAQDNRGRGPGAGGGAGVEPAVVPAHEASIILGRAGDTNVTASVLSWSDGRTVIAYGSADGELSRRTAPRDLRRGEPVELDLIGLQSDAPFAYRMEHTPVGGVTRTGEVLRAHTRRAPGSAFTFAIQADSHLDVSTSTSVYQRTLANISADRPDFLIDLGDTTMVDKFRDRYSLAESQYRAQRWYLGQVARQAPLFLVLGNHDGEKGERHTGAEDCMPVWSARMRKKYFPNPEPGGIFTGNAEREAFVGPPQNYYAWQWGDALFVVLDPFRPTRQRGRGDNWNMTLGEAQYRWLGETLAGSRAAHKFVFIHHLVGGLGRDTRGGAACAPYLEWGGKNPDGTDGFAAHRPGWAMPVHELLRRHRVSVVFHGHDHLYAREELDGIVYQEVPQPGHPSGGTRSAAEYGYTGVILGSSGHLRVRVDAREAAVEYVRAIVPGVTRDAVKNGSVAHRYSVPAR